MQEISKIYFSRNGGFAGFNLNLSLNINELAEPEAHKLQNLITGSGITEFRESTGKEKGADLFSYSIVLETAQGSETININQQEVTPGAEPLIHYLSDLAKKRR